MVQHYPQHQQLRQPPASPRKKHSPLKLVVLAVVAFVVLIGLAAIGGAFSSSGSDSKTVPPPTPTAAATTPTAAQDPAAQRLRTAFKAGNASQAWYGEITAVDLDGKAVMATSTMAKGDPGAVAACNALLKSAQTARVPVQSVAVRDNSAGGRTLAHYSKLAGDKACSA